MGMLVEVRSNGAQTMAPPSIHPCGENVAFACKDCDFAEIDMDALLRRATLLAACTVFLKYYPIKGSRNEFALALAGALLRVGCWEVEDIEKALQGVCYNAGDEEWQERVRVVRATYEKISKGEPVTGFPALETHLGQQNAELIKKWCRKLNPDGLGYDDVNAEQLIETLNKQYAFVLLGGKAMIMKFPQQDGHVEPEFLTVAGVREYFQNRIIHNPRRKKAHTFADFWLTHPKRRTYEGVVFAPMQEVEGYYNFWQGFAVTPVEGDCSKFLWHAKHVICAGNETYYTYLLAWLASIIQEPQKKTGTSLVIRGKQGTGKSIFVKYFADLLGSHYMVAEDPRYITGRFNGHLLSCMLLHAEEGFWAGDKTAEGILKEMITGSHLNIELKGKEPFKIKN